MGQRLELGTTRHGLDQLLAGDRLALELVGHPAAVEQVEAVADHVRVVRVVGDEHDRDPALARLEDVLQDDARLPDPQRARGLVEDQHLGAEVDRPGDRDCLALTAGQRADRLLHGRGCRCPSPAAPRDRRVLALPVSRNLNGPNPAPRLVAEEEVPPHRHQRDGGQVLEHGRDAGASASRGVRERRRLAVHEELALAGLVHAAEDLDQRRLAGAVVAEHAGDGAGVHVQRDVAQRDHAAEALAHVLELQRRHHRSLGWRRGQLGLGDLVEDGLVGHLFAPAARLLMKVLTRTAAKRITPRNSQVQSVFQPA